MSGRFGQAAGRIRQCVALGLAVRAAARSPLHVAVAQRKTRANPFEPYGSIRVVEARGQPLQAIRHPTTRAFRLFGRTAYFFLAARPRPAGAARNEMPVRIAFC